jgi:hypothetical protein
VLGERDRLVQELAIYRSQARSSPRGAAAPAVRRPPRTAGSCRRRGGRRRSSRPLRALHAQRVVPAAASSPSSATCRRQALGLVEARCRLVRDEQGVRDARRCRRRRPARRCCSTGPGAVQTTLRMAASAPSRADADYAAFVLANLVFGGYFSSRWVANIREDKGYTYSPHAQVEHPPAGSRVSISADVSTPDHGARAARDAVRARAGSRPRRSARASSTRPAATPSAASPSAPQPGRARRDAVAAGRRRARRRVPARLPQAAGGRHRRRARSPPAPLPGAEPPHHGAGRRRGQVEGRCARSSTSSWE